MLALEFEEKNKISEIRNKTEMMGTHTHEWKNRDYLICAGMVTEGRRKRGRLVISCRHGIIRTMGERHLRKNIGNMEVYGYWVPEDVIGIRKKGFGH